MPNRIDQLGKNVIFQGMDEPLSHSGRGKNSPLVQSLNSPSAETEKK